MKLILMTTPNFFIEEHQILTALFDEGLDILHIRKPHTEPVYSERLLSLIPEEFRKRIMVHDHYYLKNEYKLKGIHLNPRNNPPEKFKGTTSCSVTTLDDARQLRKSVDYMILSPATPETGTIQSGVDEALFEQYSKEKLVDSKLMYMAGASLENIGAIKSAGFGGAVLYGCIWNRFDLHSSDDFKDVTGYFRKIRKNC